MKKIYLVLSLFLSVLTASAQTIVSTQQSKKKVLLEELTGIHCTYCPDGHRRADLLVSSKPNNVFVVNIHAGGYATPGAGEPDFRTTFGTKVDRLASVSGYPSGTINRTKFTAPTGIALSRVEWAGFADTILNQNANVNIAVDASIADTSNRKLSVLVETYVTNTSLNGKYLLNVYLVQNGIIGPQTGSFRYPAEIQPNNMYEHNKMLRAIITPEWGDTLDFSNASSNRLTSKTYNYTIPNDVKSVRTDIKNVYVVAFLTEIDKKSVLNVAQDKRLLPANIAAYLEYKKGNISNKDDYCLQNRNTEITIKNVGTNTISSFDINYTLGTSKLSKKYTGSLSPNQEAKISIPLALKDRGYNNFFFGNIKNVKSSSNTDLILLDKRPLFSSESLLYLKDPISSFPYIKTFESASSNTYNFGSNINYLSQNSLQNPPAYKLGGAGKSATSLVFGYASTTARALTDLLDFTNITGDKLGMSFLYAGALVGGNENPSLSISYSDNCGTSWNELWKKSGKDLVNNPPSTNLLLPPPDKWSYVSIPLNQLKGKKEILFEIKFESNLSNFFYLDDIKVGANVLSTNSVLSSSDVLDIYPNPANKEVFINLTTSENNNKINNKPLTIKVTDILGRILLEKETFISDLKKYVINTSTFNSGIYLLELSSENIRLTKKLVIQK